MCIRDRLNPVLTIIPVVTAIIMLLVTSKLAGRSGKYYVHQQRDLGAVDGLSLIHI